MNRRLLAVFPAALVPATIIAAGKLHLPNALFGAIIGVLIGLALVALLAPRRCPPSPA
ncbi:hypothetical protein AB2M62_00165 [Sphingomonas sp. MMS12-HWE2-04]|uniref:hypothetical protein n=1 Tax=Sphingomonas sp. MMS12-HWE2-04 TaxID=3234199 RepID=UPI003851544F